MSSIKKNFIYSSVLTISGYLFPLLTYPYITRVLGVNKIGICDFVDSIISYGVLFSMMGLGTIAIREIAQNKGDKKNLSSTFSSLLLLNLLTSAIAISALLFLAFFIPKFIPYQKLLIIGASKILFNALMIEWLYKGLEEFRFITIRSLVIKVLYVISVFLFIRTSEDYVLYFIINVAILAVNSIINLVYSQKFLVFTFKDINIFRYFKPFVLLGFYQLLTSMYTSFNVTYLGLVTDTIEVGYYSTAVKLYTIILAVFTAFTGVMMPRLSALLGEGNLTEFLRLSNKSVDLLLTCVTPLIVFVLCFADHIILLLAGAGYEGAVLPLRIIVPLLLVIGYEQIIVIQMLMPLKKDKAILINSIIGAFVGILLNILVVSRYKSAGSAIVWIASELSVMITAQFFISKYIDFNFPFKKILNRVLWSLPFSIIYFGINQIELNTMFTLLLGGTLLVAYYLSLESFVYKNQYILLIGNKLRGLKL